MTAYLSGEVPYYIDGVYQATLSAATDMRLTQSKLIEIIRDIHCAPNERADKQVTLFTP